MYEFGWYNLESHQKARANVESCLYLPESSMSAAWGCNYIFLDQATLPCQNSGYIDPICMKQKTAFKLTKVLKVHHTIA